MKKYILFTLRMIVVVILIQTLRFKFTAHPESVYIFTKIGLEPYGRIGIGIIELIISILLVFHKTVWLGAMLTVGVMGGAVFMHLTTLGIEVMNDFGVLFYSALLTFIIAIALVWLYRKDFPIIGNKFNN
ncbi:MAG TPA: DoxX family protein [Flavobacteriia bacterium]|nr:DoxX family protein [Flavobacteriia bacterium]